MPVMVRCRSAGTMLNYSKSNAWRLLLIAAASFFLFIACRAPLQITDGKVNESCDMQCISWTTNDEARCKVTFCDETQCYATDGEPEWGMLHSNTIPKCVHNIQVYAEGGDGQTVLLEFE